MNKLLFNYNLKNIMLLTQTALISAISINLIAPIITIYIIHNFTNHISLFFWLCFHILIIFARLYIIKTLLELFQTNSKKITFYANLLFVLVILTSLLYTYIIWLSILSNMPDANIFMLSAVILTFSAGSISTLLGVFHIFAIFIFINMLSLVSAFIYHGGDMYYVFSIVLSLFSIVFIKAGHAQYKLINDIVTLKETFQSIYNKSVDSVVLISNYKFKDCNSAALQMFELETKEELIESDASKFMPLYQEDGTLSVRKMIKMTRIALKHGNNSFEWLYKRKDGTLFWTDVALTRVYIDGEEIIHSVYRDITQKKELEREKDRFQESLQRQVAIEVEKNRQQDKALLQQSRLAQMGEMISMIAHQWRQPLSAISATSGSMIIKAKLGKLDTDTSIELSQKITKYAQHLSSTIDDFRNFFKNNKTKSDTTLEQITLETLEIVQLSLEHVNIEVVTNFNSNIVLSTYANEIKQVVLNLIKNAEDVLIEREIKNPQIFINTYEATISISDNAGGIPKDILDKIFDPYFSTKTQKDGTGLGLYMSKIIIEEHCFGKLLVQNDELGAKFSIVLEKEND